LRLPLLLLAVLLVHLSANGEQAELPKVVPAGRPAVGLALEGGGALGLAHIGVIQWLEENHIPVDRIAGTSMGSLVGAVYASGTSPAEMRKIAEGDAFNRVFTLQLAYTDSSFRRREDRRELPQAFTLGLKSRYAFRNALLSDRGVNEFLATYLRTTNRSPLDYNLLPIPFRCVATDLNTLEPVTFSSGPLPRAVRASISIPGVFPPVEDKDHHMLVDGGIVDNLPTDLVAGDLKAGIIIGVRLEDSPLTAADTGSIVGVLNRAFSAGIAANVNLAEKKANILIRVPVGAYTSMEYDKAHELIEAGYRAAEAHRNQLLPLALTPQDWASYLSDRDSRRLPLPGNLQHVKVDGGNADVRAQTMAELKPLHGRLLEPAPTDHALKNIEANGTYSTTWESYSQSSSANANALGLPDSGLLVHLHKDEIGPPYLLISPEYAAANSNTARGELSIRLIDQDFGTFGSELRADAQAGYRNAFHLEYYRLVHPGGYFLEPEISFSRNPVEIWSNQKRIAERTLESMDAGLVAGRTFSKHAQIAAHWQFLDTRYSLAIGSGGGSYISGTAQRGWLQLDLDQAKASSISPSGYRISASLGALYHAVDTGNAPIGHFNFSHSYTWHDRYILGLGGEANTSFRSNLAQPFRFTMGGPMRLSAASFDEFRSTDNYLARAGIMRRIAALPTGLGQGLYATVGYEGAEFWSPESTAILHQDIVTGLVVNSPVGLVTFGTSVGDTGHRKVFITVGHWF